MTVSTASAAATEPAPAGLPTRVRRWIGDHSRALLIALLIVLTLFAYAAPSMVTVVPAGHGGVLWRALDGGTVHHKALGEGVHLIAPWNRVFLYDLRQHEETRTYAAIAGNGLSIQVDIGFIYRLRPETLGNMHRKVGPDFLEVLLMSQIGTVARDSIARWPADALYGPERSKIEADIFNRLVDRANINGITAGDRVTPKNGANVIRTGTDSDEDDYFELNNVMIREVTLPEQVQSAIRRKIEQQEMVLEYQHRLDREKLESERKAVEAEGIRKFQETVRQGISDTYLAWRGIEATIQLATSNNAKVVVIGNNSHGLPIIFNTGPDTGTGTGTGTGTAGTGQPSVSLPEAAATAFATPPVPQRKPETDPPPERAVRAEQERKPADPQATHAEPVTEKDAAGGNALLTIPYLGLTVPQPFR
ncbi:prohibitin family protein [Azospirillum isscasi]|uniref:Prohibitin family protein n=1 Tax=Azospirillum isscasi TaxID=3053926 RepID=A0ABU0WPH5_9PROT|nr:prohibitin family protein [Azospirillum isscasi]MDQ2105878.1 prohibitin family protein [Azospirillum isscasi]